MKAAFLILAASAFLACAGLPRIVPAGEKERSDIIDKCALPFLSRPWRLVHSIDGTLPGGATATMIGVTVASPETGRLRCTLMSIEGLVILDADYDAKLDIKRGIGPLADPDLVMGMIRDIRLMLFRPAGSCIEAGLIDGGSAACRFRVEEGMVDVITRTDGGVDIVSYDASQKPSRTVRLSDFRADGLPRRIELTASGLFSYSLKLDLIEAEQLGQRD
jgi:hypothetical protein